MKTLAIYPGSFNPFHLGHLNIIQKAEKVFGEGNVLIAIGINPDKENSVVTSVIRAEEIGNKLQKTVEVYSSFLHEFIEQKEAEGYNVVIVRGLRNGNDLDYEDNQIKFIKDFKKDINVVFFRCDEEFSHISSSAIRSLQKFRPGSGDIYLI